MCVVQCEWSKNLSESTSTEVRFTSKQTESPHRDMKDSIIRTGCD